MGAPWVSGGRVSGCAHGRFTPRPTTIAGSPRPQLALLAALACAAAAAATAAPLPGAPSKNTGSSVPGGSGAAGDVPSALRGGGGAASTNKRRLTDWGFAGYHQGADPLPELNVTLTLDPFTDLGMSDAEALEATLEAAHTQAGTYDFVVIGLPPRRINITRPLVIQRPRLVLRWGTATDLVSPNRHLRVPHTHPAPPRRGAGVGNTILVMPLPLSAVLEGGSSVGNMDTRYAPPRAWVSVKGSYRATAGSALARVVADSLRGSHQLVVSSTRALEVGQMVQLVMAEDAEGTLATYMCVCVCGGGGSSVERGGG